MTDDKLIELMQKAWEEAGKTATGTIPQRRRVRWLAVLNAIRNAA